MVEDFAFNALMFVIGSALLSLSVLVFVIAYCCIHTFLKEVNDDYKS